MCTIRPSREGSWKWASGCCYMGGLVAAPDLDGYANAGDAWL